MKTSILLTTILAVICFTNGNLLPNLTNILWPYTDCGLNNGSADCIGACGEGDGSNGRTTCTNQVILSPGLVNRKICNCRSVELKTMPSTCELLDGSQLVGNIACYQTCNLINTGSVGAACSYNGKKYCSCIQPVLVPPVDDPTWPYDSCTLDLTGGAKCVEACGVATGTNGASACVSQIIAGGGITRRICNCRSGSSANVPTDTCTIGLPTCSATCNLLSTGDIGYACKVGDETFCSCFPI